MKLSWKSYLVFITLALLVACGDKKTNSAPVDRSGDLGLLQDQEFPQRSDRMDALLKSIFGGSTGADMLEFHDQRVGTIITQDEWRRARITYANGGGESYFQRMQMASEQQRFYGYNPTWQLYRDALTEGSIVRVEVDDQVTQIRSNQEGLVVLGDILVSNQGWSSDPYFRISVLLHEARHSDCEPAQGVQNASTLVSLISDSLRGGDTRCGNAHKLCEGVNDSRLAGRSACDSHLWGAYFVEYLYDLATLDNLPPGASKDILRMSAADSRTHMEYDVVGILTSNSLPSSSSQQPQFAKSEE